MADLTITAANVIPVAGYTYEDGIAGATITRGQCVYRDSSDSNKFKLADANGTAAQANVYGIALQDAGASQPLRVMRSGDLGLGAILTAAQVYIVSTTAGAIAPVSDLASSSYLSILGYATSTSNLRVDLAASGTQKA